MHGEAEVKPRQRNAVKTRQSILAAAQRTFSSVDYTQAKISDIAKDAGVNQALVIRYFQSKEKLFETALTETIEQRWSVADFRGDRNLVGEHIANQMIADELSQPDPFAMAVHAASNPRARAIASGLVEARIVKVLSKSLGDEPATVRATEVLAMCAGLFTFRRLLPLDLLQGDCNPEFRRWFAATVQEIFDRQPHVNDR
jgi:AcrR family transcriptional regulator